jgi:TRAP-type C4-dicarboxylate transport system substrate-binding protein
MIKRIAMHVLCGAFGVALLATSVWAGSAIELTYANFPPPKTFPSVQMERWADEVEARTSGKVSVKTFPGGTLLKAKAMMDGVVDGVADIGCVAFPYQPGRFQLLAGADLPIGFPNSKVANAVLWDLYKKYDPASLKGVKVLALFTAPPAAIMSKDPIRKMSDLSGYELRSTGAGVAPLKILGAVPVSMPMPATVEALQKGVVKGVLSSTDILMDFKFATQVYYTTRADLQTTSFGVVMNLDKWNALPADVKDIFEGLAREQSMWTGTYVDEHGKESIEWSEKNHKHEYIELAAAEYEKWHKLMQPITDEWLKKTAAKGLPAQAFLDDLLQLKAKYTAELGN